MADEQRHYCPICQYQNNCDRCRRLNSIGLIMDSLKVIERTSATMTGDPLRAFVTAIVGEIGLMIVERERMMRAWRRDMMEEQREAQRAARDAFSDGFAEGMRSDD